MRTDCVQSRREPEAAPIREVSSRVQPRPPEVVRAGTTEWPRLHSAAGTASSFGEWLEDEASVLPHGRIILFTARRGAVHKQEKNTVMHALAVRAAAMPSACLPGIGLLRNICARHHVTRAARLKLR